MSTHWLAQGRGTTLTGLLMGLLLSACGQPARVPAPTGPATAPYPTVTVGSAAVAGGLQLDGRVEAQDQGTVSAQTSGEIVALLHDAGDRVAAGAVVMRLRAVQQQASLQQADAALRAATARATEVETRYRRTADLYARQLVARADLDAVSAQRDSAVAEREAAQAAQRAAAESLGYTEVRMPYSGVITERLVRVGEMVAPGAPLFAAAATSGPLRVLTEISQDLVPAVERGLAGTIVANGREIAARRVVLLPRGADATALFRVRLDLPAGTAGLLPGMFVKVRFGTGTSAQLRVPTRTIVERGEVTGVYLFQPEGAGRTLFRQLRLGERTDDDTVVLAGLAAGDLVATDPAAALRHLQAAERGRQ